MPDTTAVYGWPIPTLTDSPNAPQQISDLADGIEGTINGTTTIAAAVSSSVTLGNSAWTTIATVSITLPVAQQVSIVGWARLVNTGATRPIVALQIVDGSTHLFGTGQYDLPASGDLTGFTPTDAILNTPRRRVGLSAGSHTLNLQCWKDANGAVTAKQISTFGSQDITTTGIEVTQ